jgi:hypothetical protein
MRQPPKALAPWAPYRRTPGARHSSVSVPRLLGCFGTKALRRSGVACRSEQLFIAAGPNPSIEGTSTSKLRLLAAAPHVKR